MDYRLEIIKGFPGLIQDHVTIYYTSFYLLFIIILLRRHDLFFSVISLNSSKQVLNMYSVILFTIKQLFI